MLSQLNSFSRSRGTQKAWPVVCGDRVNVRLSVRVAFGSGWLRSCLWMRPLDRQLTSVGFWESWQLLWFLWAGGGRFGVHGGEASPHRLRVGRRRSVRGQPHICCGHCEHLYSGGSAPALSPRAGVSRAWLGGCQVCVPVFAAGGSPGGFRLWCRDRSAGWRALGGFGRVAETSEMLGRFIFFISICKI